MFCTRFLRPMSLPIEFCNKDGRNGTIEYFIGLTLGDPAEDEDSPVGVGSLTRIEYFQGKKIDYDVKES